MADNVIRNDVVRLSLNVDGLNQLNRLQGQLTSLGNQAGGRLNQQTERLRSTLTDIGKKAAVAAYNGLKKLAAITFKALVAGITSAAAAVGTLVTKSVQAYADYEQLVGGVETLFKDSAGEVFANAGWAFKNAGLSYNEYLETVTGFSASLIQSLGGDTKKAAEYANVAITDMSDNANKMGSDMESIMNAYQGFSKQNYTMLDNLKLGYGGTQEEMSRLVKDASKLKDVQKELGVTVDGNSMSYANIVQAIHVVQANMGILGTTEKEAATTISGSLNMVKASWKDCLTFLQFGGDELNGSIDILVESVYTFLGNLTPVIEGSLKGIGELIERVAPMIEQELPKLINALLPPLLNAAVAIIKGLIKSLPDIFKVVINQLPSILKQIGDALIEAFGIEDIVSKISKSFKNAFEKNPVFEKIGDFFEQNSDKIKNSIPIIGALIGTILAFNKIKSIGSLLSGLFAGGSISSETSGGIFGIFTNLAEMKITTVLKGLANLGIIFGGLLALSGIMMAAAPYMAKLSDGKSLIELLAVITALGAIGTGLAELAGIAGAIPVSAAAKGLANMAIMIGGMSALALLIGAVSLMNFGYTEMYKLVGFITVLGAVGTVLSVFAGIVGNIPITNVLLGFTNIALVITGLSALTILINSVAILKFDYSEMYKLVGFISVLGVVSSILSVFAGIIGLIPVTSVLLGLANICLVITALSGLTILINSVALLQFDYMEMYKLVGFITVLGTVGTVLSVFAGIAGTIPISAVLAGLANIALVIGGLTAIIAAFGELSKIDGFNEFISTGGDTLANLFKQIGKTAGSLVSGFAEGILDILPTIGKKLSEFATNIKPLFTLFQNVDMTGVSSFFSSLGSFMLKMAGNDIAGLFTGGTDLEELGTQLSNFTEKAKGFFTTAATFPETGFANAKLLFQSLSDIGNVPNTGGIAQWFSGKNDFTALAVKLPPFGEAMAAFYESISAITDFDKIKQLFKALNGLGKAIPNTGGIAQWFSGKNDLLGVGIQLKQFGENAKSFFEQAAALNVENLSALWASLKKAGEIAAIDFGGLAERGTALTAFMTNIQDFFTGAAAAVANTENVQNLATALQNFFTAVAGTAATDLSGMANGLNILVNAVQLTANSFAQLGAVITDTVTSGIAITLQFQTTFTTSITSMVTAVQTGTVQIIAIISEMLATITTAVASVGSAGLSRAGAQMINGLISGMNSKKEEAVSTARKIAQAINDEYKKIQDINSPSKVWESYGAYQIQGNINGMKKYMPELKSAVREAGRITTPYNNYTPENSAAEIYNANGGTEYNSYSPVFNLTISGSGDDTATARKIKKWVREALNETFESMNRRSPQLKTF